MSVELLAIAATQYGVVNGAQAQGCGYGPREIQRLCRNGEWWAPRRGIYLPAPEPKFEVDQRAHHALRIAAALLGLGRADAVAAYLSAGMLWDLEWLADPDLNEVWLAWPLAGKVRHYDDVRVLTSGLPAEHVTVDPGGIPVCTVARTIIDLARHLPFRNALVLADSGMHRWGVTRADLEEVLDGCRHWPGKLAAERVVAFADGRAESVAESLARILFVELGLPRPDLQVEIRYARVDFLFRGRWVVVEVDGKVKYVLDADARWKEKLREDRIREAGYEVVRLTWADLVGRPERVRTLVLEAFARAERIPR